MLIPYSTDAPLYHYPIGTVGLIIVNVIFYIAFCSDGQQLVDEHTTKNPFVVLLEQHENGNDPDRENDLIFDSHGAHDPEWEENEPLGGPILIETPEVKRSFARHLNLDFGEGYKPWQWVTNAFMHAGIMHLVGNMIFLWVFGLVVEGKIGTPLFLTIYLGIAIVQSIAIQTCMWFATEGFSLGASSAIFGLLGIVAIWAPRNEFDTFVWLLFRPSIIEIPIMVFAGIYISINLVFWWLQNWQMSSEALHISGLAVGIPIGWLMLAKGYVDCEGYDIVSVWQGKEGKDSQVGRDAAKARRKKQREKEKRAAAADIVPVSADQLAAMHNQVTEAIQAGNCVLAQRLQSELSRNHPQLQWRESDLRLLISALLQQKEYLQVCPLIESYLASFTTHRVSMQATMTKCMLALERPRAAIGVLKTIDQATLSPAQRETFKKLVQTAQQQIAEGVVEFQ